MIYLLKFQLEETFFSMVNVKSNKIIKINIKKCYIFTLLDLIGIGEQSPQIDSLLIIQEIISGINEIY